MIISFILLFIILYQAVKRSIYSQMLDHFIVAYQNDRRDGSLWDRDGWIFL